MLFYNHYLNTEPSQIQAILMTSGKPKIQRNNISRLQGRILEDYLLDNWEAILISKHSMDSLAEQINRLIGEKIGKPITAGNIRGALAAIGKEWPRSREPRLPGEHRRSDKLGIKARLTLLEEQMSYLMNELGLKKAVSIVEQIDIGEDGTINKVVLGEPCNDAPKGRPPR